MKLKPVLVTGFTGCLFTLNLCAAQLGLTSIAPNGNVTWTNAFTNGVCTIESVDSFAASNVWKFQQSYFTSNSTGSGSISITSNHKFFHAFAVDVSTNTALGQSNLTRVYGRLQTIAGNGTGGTDNVNYWKSSYEGGFATNAALSRPHHAIADTAGNIYIVDKCSHSVLKVTLDGRIYTVAGTHVGGYNGDGPAPATSLELNQPNGLYLNSHDTVYILDTGNGRVRRLDTNGTMTTLFVVPGGISGGRGLWVAETEAEAVFCDGSNLKYWTRTNGIVKLNSNFIDLGNIILDTADTVLATDRGDNTVWRVQIHGKNSGTRTLVYGSGNTAEFVEGTSAVSGSLYGVRGIWKMPCQGYLLATHEGSQLIYVDASNIGHLWLNGLADAHSGDGQWFHTSGYKISQARSVSVDYQGNILLVESDYGYLRRIEFRRMGP